MSSEIASQNPLGEEFLSILKEYVIFYVKWKMATKWRSFHEARNYPM